MNNLKYKRILLKFSGEALSGNKGYGLDRATLDSVVREIIEVKNLGAQIGIVIGGGNIFRGLSDNAAGMDRVRADYMGMLATVINGIAVQDALIAAGVPTRLMSAINMAEIAEPMAVFRAEEFLSRGEVVIFAAGTGRPFFSTDTGAALRAVEIGADAFVKATKVDGVYDKDPMKFSDAVKYDILDYSTAISQNLRVMDQTAFSLCKDNNMPIIVCNMFEAGTLKQVMQGATVGTLVSGR